MSDRWGAAERTIVLGIALAAAAFAISLPASAFAVASTAVVGLVAAVALAILAGFGPRAWRPWARGAAAATLIGVAWGMLAYDSVEQTTGGLTVRIDDPRHLSGDAGAVVHRVGQGPVLLDLRGLQVPPPSPSGAPVRLRLRARADTDNIVVALPERACLRVVVRHRRLSPRPEIFDRLVALAGLSTDADVPPEALTPEDGGTGLSETEELAKQYGAEASDTANLLAYGRSIDDNGTLVRAAADRQAPTLEIDAEAGGQIGVRNYPEDRELRKVVFPSLQAALGWPGRHLERPMAPANAVWQQSAGGTYTLRTPGGKRLEREHRAKVRAWAVREARRAAGPCPTRADLASRLIALGPGTPIIDGLAPDREVYVDGLGRVHSMPRGSRVLQVVG